MAQDLKDILIKASQKPILTLNFSTWFELGGGDPLPLLIREFILCVYSFKEHRRQDYLKMNGSERIKEYIDGGINNVFDILHNLIHDYNQCTYDVISPNFSLTRGLRSLLISLSFCCLLIALLQKSYAMIACCRGPTVTSFTPAEGRRLVCWNKSIFIHQWSCFIHCLKHARKYYFFCIREQVRFENKGVKKIMTPTVSPLLQRIRFFTLDHI